MTKEVLVLRLIFSTCLVLVLCQLSSQTNQHVLFIGNSYTGANNLPVRVQEVASSAGFELTFASHTPGGSTLFNHVNNDDALELIGAGGYDHVIIQAQSQEPSFPIAQVEQQTFPYAEILCDSIRAAEPCTRPIFYMTWGRENGDQQNCAVWPPVCTYEGMDDLLSERYLLMAEMNESYVSPVGAVWRYLRDSGSSIQLYTSDGSHPTLAGSYAAACAFFTIIFEADPLMITEDVGLDSAVALEIREAAHEVAYLQMADWYVGAYDPLANFSSELLQGFEYQFIDTSENSDEIDWILAGNSATGDTVSWTFPGPGDYEVTQIVSACGVSDTLTQTLSISTLPDNLEESVLTASDILLLNGRLHLQVDEALARLTILDTAGRVCLNLYRPDQELFDISGFSAGVHILRIETLSGAQGSVRFVIAE